jgi:hypothetical protein
MNLFRKHKKFEDQLKEQLGDTEYKPSASLWDRIDSDITKDAFEKGMQNSLENFEQVPYSDTWDKIAAELPESKTRNYQFKYYGWSALTLLFAIGVWVGYEWNKPNNTRVASSEKIKAHSMSSGDQRTINPAAEYTQSEATTNTNTRSQSAPLLLTPPLSRKSPEKPKTQTRTAVSAAPAHAVSAVSEEVSNRSGKLFLKTQQSQVKLAQSIETAIASGPQPVAIGNNFVGEKKAVTQKEPLPLKGGLTQVETAAPSAAGTPAAVASENVSTNLAANQEPAAVQFGDARNLSSPTLKPDSSKNQTTFGAAVATHDDLSRVSISIMAGAHMCYMNYVTPSDPQFNFEQNIALRKSLERPDIDWSGGFLIDYRISPKWMLSSGLMMVNFSQQFDYNTLPATNPVNPNETYGAVYKSTDSVITGNGYSNRIKYSWTEIPLYVNYNLRRGERWDIDLQAGAGYAFINTVDAGMVAQDNKGVFALKDKDAFPQIKNSVFVSFMPQLSYRFGQNVSIGFVPTFKYSVTSIIGNDRWVQQHPYFLGMNICLRKRF